MALNRPSYYLRRATELPLRETIRKGLRLIASEARNRARRARDERSGTYVPPTWLPNGDLRRRLRWGFPEGPAHACAPDILALADAALAHRFDLLGSGPVEVRHGMACAGVQGVTFPPELPVLADPEGVWLQGRVSPPNLDESRRLWRMIGEAHQGYVPIDWQLDFRSGFRWSERMWYRDVPFGHVRGADVKLPWEMGRMQHLTQLGLAYGVSRGHAHGSTGASYLSEFRNQVLDFMATNPPRYGVQWVCTMDVAIRVANWLIAYDLFRSAGAQFDEPFEAVFRRSIFEHALHIVTNLEWWDGDRGNHYLADVAGLVFASAYLPRSRASDAWLDFAAGELMVEVRRQFHEDGGHFEASTGYHRLAAEMVVFSGALLAGFEPDDATCLGRHGFVPGGGPPRLWPPPAPSSDHTTHTGLLEGGWFSDRLVRMGRFVRDYSDAAGGAPQIGDDDSGRFFKLTPAILPDGSEAVLDHRHLSAAVTGLVEGVGPANGASGCIDAAIVRDLAAGRRLGTAQEPTIPEGRRVRPPSRQAEDRPAPGFRTVIRFQWSDGMSGRPLLATYPDFGLFCYRLGTMQLTVRAPRTTTGVSGHRHCDALSLTMSVGGSRIVIDPGSPFYSSFPELHTTYRSSGMHNGPLGGHLPLDGSKASVEVMEASEARFAAEVSAADAFARRTLTFEPTEVSLVDETSVPMKGLTFLLGHGVDCEVEDRSAALSFSGGFLTIVTEVGGWRVECQAASPGYGRLEECTALRWVPE